MILLFVKQEATTPGSTTCQGCERPCRNEKLSTPEKENYSLVLLMDAMKVALINTHFTALDFCNVKQPQRAWRLYKGKVSC